MASSSAQSASPARVAGRRLAPVREVRARRMLLLATAAVILGSFLPWVSTALGNVPGYRGAGLWTFYAAMLGLTGAFVPWRRVALVQGAVLAAVAVALPAWQVVHLLQLVGTSGWLPGLGLVLVLGGGAAAGLATWRLATPEHG